MAKSDPLAQEFYLHGYDIGGDIGAIEKLATRRVNREAPDITLSAMARLQGLGDGEMAFSGYFDDAAEKGLVALKGAPTTDVIAMWLKGGTIGDTGATLVAKQVSLDWTRNQDRSLGFTAQCIGAAGVVLEFMEALTPGLTTHGSAGSVASKDDAASSASGAAAVVEIVDIDSGTPTIIIEDSPNDSSWSTLISFSAVAAGNEPTAERKTVSGTVNRYLRITTTGTFSNADFAIAYRRGTAQDVEGY
jgi:hypothetical protein